MYKKAISIIISLMLMGSSVSVGAAGFYYSNPGKNKVSSSSNSNSSSSSSYTSSFSYSSSSVTEYSEEHFENSVPVDNNTDETTQNNDVINDDFVPQETTEDVQNFIYETTPPQYTIIVEEVPTEVLTEPETEVPIQSVMNINATSNLFPAQTKVVDTSSTDTITVSYFISSDMSMLNNEWELTYDPNVLSFEKSYNINEFNKINLMPMVGSAGSVYNYSEPGSIKANASSISLYDIPERGTFVTATFKIIGVGDTNVNLDVKTLSLAEYDYSTDSMKEDSNVSITKVSQLCDAFYTDVKSVDTVIYEGLFNPDATNPYRDVVEETNDVTIPVTIPETTIEETELVTIPETTVEPIEEVTIPETTVEETEEVTIPETTVEETEEITVPEATVEETLETTVVEETQVATESETKIPASNDEIRKDGYYVSSISNMFSSEEVRFDKSTKTFSVIYYLKSKTPVLNSQFEVTYDINELKLLSAEMPIFKEGSVINTKIDGAVYANASSLSMYDFSDKAEFVVLNFERKQAGENGFTEVNLKVDTLTFAETNKDGVVDIDTITTVYKNGVKVKNDIKYSNEVEIITSDVESSDATPDEATKPSISEPDNSQPSSVPNSSKPNATPDETPTQGTTNQTDATSSTGATTSTDATSSVSTKDTAKRPTTSTNVSTSTTTTTTTNVVKTGSTVWAIVLFAILSSATGVVFLANRKRNEE